MAQATPANHHSFHVSTALAIAIIAGAQLMIVLDATIVNVALPHIQYALGFSPTGLSWVLNGYTLAFGGLLLLGGKSGDLFGRRRMFMLGILLFAGASLVGGFATDQAWLITARAVQGVGGAIASPTALSLITTNFAEGKERNEALGIYSAVSAAGAALGLLAGGLLTQYISWRWVFFVNAPIALAIAIATPRALKESARQRVRLDVAGALLSVAGLGLLVFGMIHAAQSGWGTPVTISSFIAAVILLAAFVWREMTGREPLMDMAIFADRTRSAAYAVMLLLAASLFAMFFFLTLFLQEVHGSSALKAGLAFLPASFGIMLFAGIGSKLIQKTGPLPLIAYGLLAVAGGLAWLSRMTIHSTYLVHILAPMLLLASGMGFAFVSIFPTALARVPKEIAGLGSAMVNVAQQVGGTLGLSVLVTVSATAMNSRLHSLLGAAGSAASQPSVAKVAAAVAAIHGWDTAFLVGSGIALVGLVVALVFIRPPRAEELAGLAAEFSV